MRRFVIGDGLEVSHAVGMSLLLGGAMHRCGLIRGSFVALVAFGRRLGGGANRWLNGRLG